MHPLQERKKNKIKKGTITIVSNAAECNAHLADHFQAPNALMHYISSDKHNRCLKRTYFCLAMRSASSRQILQFGRRYQRSDHHTHIE
jgi:hypothetical protein